MGEMDREGGIICLTGAGGGEYNFGGKLEKKMKRYSHKGHNGINADKNGRESDLVAVFRGDRSKRANDKLNGR